VLGEDPLTVGTPRWFGFRTSWSVTARRSSTCSISLVERALDRPAGQHRGKLEQQARDDGAGMPLTALTSALVRVVER